MFDTICKFLAENYSRDFAAWLLGQPITLTELSPGELSLEPIRADAIILLQSEETIVHIEFQTDPKNQIPFRMADYRLRGYRRFPQKQMQQFVIYLRPTNSQEVFKNTFDLERTHHEFNVIRIWEQRTEEFLRSPGLLPFAVLTKTTDRESVLREVAREIDSIPSRTSQSDITASTAILAGLLLDQGLIKKVLRSDIMRESVIYQEILQEGELIGEKRGEQRGQLKALEKVALNMLNAGISIEQIVQITGLSVEQIGVLDANRQGNS